MKSRALPLAFLALALVGCGGGSGGSSPAGVAPRLAIAWGARTRDVTAPSSALSATVILAGASENGTDFGFYVERPEGTAATTQTYTAPAAARQKVALMRVLFFSGPTSTGTVVGEAATTVKVSATGDLTRADGSPLGTLGTVGTVRSARIPEGQSVDVGTTTDLAAEALGAEGFTLALSPGSYSLQVTEGTDVLRANGSLGVTALAEGVATVVATVDGKVSPPIPVTVNGPAVATRSINVLTNQLRYDATHARLWASVAPGGGGGDAVVDIDPATGALGTPIPVGSKPRALAVSDDGTTLYVGLDGESAVRRVDLNAHAAGPKFAIPNDFTNDPIGANDIAIQPGNDDVIALTPGAGSNGRGPEIYDGGVRRPNVLQTYQGSQVVWTSPTRIVAFDGITTGEGLYDGRVDANGVTLVRSIGDAFDSFSADLTYADGRLYGSDGTVRDALTFSKLGQFPHEAFSVYDVSLAGPVVDVAANRAYFVQFGPVGARLRAYRLDTFASVTNRALAGVTGEAGLFNSGDLSLVRWGSHGLAFRTVDRVYFVDVSGL